MQRREFITLLGGVAVGWPLTARAQQPDRIRRIGVLMNLLETDPQSQARIAAFVQGLRELGWVEGRNLRIDYRWAAGDTERQRKYAAELVALGPDVLLGWGTAISGASRTVPIVFAQSIDPVGAGFVDSMARPGRNVTGFTQFEYSLSAKWPELLKEIAPSVARAAVLRDAGTATGAAQWAMIQAGASSRGMEVSPINLRDVPELERAIAAFARAGDGGLVVTVNSFVQTHRELIIALAARHKLPAVYFERFFVTGGGLVSYGPNIADQYRRAAGYVDRILKGEKPADLPVQSPTKIETAINLKTAKALGLTVPPALVARADEVIE
jgi:putative tryptophan/tyrosine transport system substrate-binding protein